MSVERNLYKRHIPFCVTRPALVDQYAWPEKDTTERICQNGVSHPIYACNGHISRTLPLDMYPTVDQIHPQIQQSSQPHFGSRDPRMQSFIEYAQSDKRQGRLEGLYM
jgi:hypothetical protein